MSSGKTSTNFSGILFTTLKTRKIFIFRIHITHKGMYNAQNNFYSRSDLFFYPEEEGNMYLRTDGTDYIAQYLRKSGLNIPCL
jgi:hypothetical protein